MNGFLKPITDIYCNIECDRGTFGADCKQTCHCGSGDTVCELDTGRCTSGGCANGWSGDNCQGNKMDRYRIGVRVYGYFAIRVTVF